MHVNSNLLSCNFIAFSSLLGYSRLYLDSFCWFYECAKLFFMASFFTVSIITSCQKISPFVYPMVSPINMVVSNKKYYMAISYRLLYEPLFSLYFFIYFFHFKQNGVFWVSANFSVNYDFYEKNGQKICDFT